LFIEQTQGLIMIQASCILLMILSGSHVASSFSTQPLGAHTMRTVSSEVVKTATSVLRSASSEDESVTPATKKDSVKPDILLPFLPAADPNYMNTASVGEDAFVVCRTGEPTKEELVNDNILRIVQIESTDLEVNTMVWKCLGYRFDEESQTWNNDLVFPKWAERFPTPPDFIGMQRVYAREVDQPSLRSNQALVRSVPVESKLSLKTHLRPLGFRGYQYSELTPNKTRRAQCANWLVYYREELFGYSVEELLERRQLKKDEEEKAKQEGEADQWKPPVKEVF
jgi:hypothetical protein